MFFCLHMYCFCPHFRPKWIRFAVYNRLSPYHSYSYKQPTTNYQLLAVVGKLYIYCNHRNLSALHIYAHLMQVLDALKLDVSENYNHNITNSINCYLHENVIMRICLMGFDTRKFSNGKIYTFTVNTSYNTLGSSAAATYM